jgi:hypothetical protein
LKFPRLKRRAWRRVAVLANRRTATAAFAASAMVAASGCGPLDLHEYAAQARAALTWDVDANTRHTGAAESDPNRDSLGYDFCVDKLDYYAPRYLAEGACHVNRNWVKGSFGWVNLENGTYIAP